MPQRGKVTLSELMGRDEGLSFDNLHEVLGDRMPEIKYTPVGRLRLTTALRNRFGDNYRHLPGVEKLLKQFDEEAKFAVKLQEMKMIKLGKKG